MLYIVLNINQKCSTSTSLLHLPTYWTRSVVCSALCKSTSCREMEEQRSNKLSSTHMFTWDSGQPLDNNTPLSSLLLLLTCHFETIGCFPACDTEPALLVVLWVVTHWADSHKQRLNMFRAFKNASKWSELFSFSLRQNLSIYRLIHQSLKETI